jgi:plasmid stability protein
MSSQPAPYPLRMPDELRDQLTERARASGRSLNAEIIAILQDAIGRNQQTLSGLDIDVLADAVADRVAIRLKKSKSS